MGVVKVSKNELIVKNFSNTFNIFVILLNIAFIYYCVTTSINVLSTKHEFVVIQPKISWKETIVGLVLQYFLLHIVLFKYSFHNFPKRVVFNESTITINNKQIDYCLGEVRFVYENLGWYNTRLRYCECFFEQGWGIKKKKYRICSFLTEIESKHLFETLVESGLNIVIEHRSPESIFDLK